MIISRPQKAPSKSITDEQLESLVYPVLGSFKLDGYRCVTHNGAFTSSLKPVTNRYIQTILSDPRFNGLDGEIIVGKPYKEHELDDVYNRTTGPVRRADGEPDFKFYVFDSLFDLNAPYCDRLKHLKNTVRINNLSQYVTVIKQNVLRSAQEVLAFEDYCITSGFEGAMIRSIDSKYKQGRCTLREQNIFKRKPVEDDECIVVGFEEQQHNMNESFINEMGNSVRSAHKENKVGKNTLGKLIVTSKLWPKPFPIGTGQGLTDELRQHIWDNQEKHLGKIWVYKYQAYGSIDAPRQPILKGMRDPNDMTGY